MLTLWIVLGLIAASGVAAAGLIASTTTGPGDAAEAMLGKALDTDVTL